MRKRALLLGVEDYKEPITQVTSVQNDINTLKYKLNQLSFEIFTNFNCKYDDIANSVDNFYEKAPTDSINIVYFTGHGFHYRGQNYVAPIDFDLSKPIEKNGYNVENFFNCSQNKITKIIVIDACRNNFEQQYKGDYTSTFSLPQDTYIAYATQFGTVASYTKYGLSHFTETICNNILFPNISVNELFEKVRYDLDKNGYPQISNCISGLRNKVVLNESIYTTNLDCEVYEYIEENGDRYEKISGYVAGEYEIFIDASQRFQIPLLDTYFMYSKIQSSKYHTDLLPEAESKLVTFFIMKDSQYFKVDNNYTWYYKGRKIRMGEIPPLPDSMERLGPLEGKAIDVEFSYSTDDTSLYLKTTLPDGFILHLTTNKTKSFINGEVNKNECRFDIKPGTREVKLTSPIVSIMKNLNQETVGEKGRNLVGNLVKFDPIFGNTIEWECSLIE